MSEEDRLRDFEPLESPLDAAVQATLAEPFLRDAVERVKVRASQLAATDVSLCRLVDSRGRGWRRPRPLAASLAVAAALLVVTGLVLAIDHSGGRAFAQMIEKVKTAGSVYFTLTTRIGQRPQLGGRMYLEGNQMRFELDDGDIVQVADLERKRSLILNTVGNEFQQVEFGGPVIAGLDANPIDQLRRVKSDDAKSMGQEILRGRRTQIYRLHEVDLLGIKGRCETIVWVDLESELPAKIVIRDADPQLATEFVFDDFVWNEPLDAQLFSLDVPDGFKPGTIALTAPSKKPDVATFDSAPAFADGILHDRVPAHVLWNRPGTTITALMRDPESASPPEQRSNELRQWDMATGKMVWSEIVAGASWVAGTADGKLLATVIGYEVQLRDAASGKITQTWVTDKRLSPLAFSPDGKTLAAGIAEWGEFGGRGGEMSGGVQLWDVERGSLVRALSDDKPVTFVRYSVDGNYLATSSNDGPLKLWDVATGELLRLFPGRSPAEFSPDGATIAFASTTSPERMKVGRVDLHNLKDASLVRSYVSENGPSASWLLGVAISFDGRLLAATDWNGVVTVWDVATGSRKLAVADHQAGVVSAAFSPDGQTLATGGEDMTLRLWKLSEGLIERTKQ